MKDRLEVLNNMFFFLFYFFGTYILCWEFKAQSLQIDKAKTVWRQDRSALFIALALAKVRLPKRAEVLHFGACDFSPVPISRLTEVTSKKLIFSFKTRFFILSYF